MAFNLFDFQDDQKKLLNPTGAALGGFSQTPKPLTQPTPLATSGMKTGQATFSRPLPQNKPSPVMDSVIPQASAENNVDEEKVKQFIQHGKDLGKSKEEIKTAFSKAMSDGIFSKQTEQTVEKPSLLQQVGTAAKKTASEGLDLLGTAIAAPFVEAPRIVGNLANFANTGIVNAIAPALPRGVYDTLTAPGRYAKEGGEMLTAQGEEAIAPKLPGLQTGTEVGEVARPASDLAASAMIPGGVLKSGVGLGQTILRGAVQGGIEAAKYSAVSRGENPTGGEVLGGAVVGGALPAAGALLKKAVQPLAQKLQVTGIINPSKLQMANEQLAAMGEDGAKIDTKSAAKWMLGKKMAGTPEQMAQQAADIATASKSAVDEGLASITQTYKNPTITNILKELKTEFTGGLSKETNALSARASELLKKSSKEGLTLSEANEVKRMIDKLNPYTATGKVKVSQSDLAAVRNELKQFIEDKAGENGLTNIKALNKETQVANTIGKAISQKSSSMQVRELITTFAPTSLGGGIIGAGAEIASGDKDPLSVIKAGLIGAVAGATIGSPAFRTKSARFLNGLTSTESKLVQDFIESRGAKELPETTFNKVKTFVNEVKNDVPKNPINTPKK